MFFKALIALQFSLILFFTVHVYGQSKTQDGRDSVQETRLAQVEDTVEDNSQRIQAIVTEMWALRSSLDRFTGIGIGLGCALTALQGIQVVLQIKRKA